MRRLVLPAAVALGAVLAALTLAITGRAAPEAAPPAKQIAAVRTQVSALQKQVRTLRSQVEDLRGEVFANYDGDACFVALTADAVQDTWAVIDEMAQATQSRTYFGPQNAISDRNGCKDARPAIGVTRPVQTAQVIPSFVKVVEWLK